VTQKLGNQSTVLTDWPTPSTENSLKRELFSHLTKAVIVVWTQRCTPVLRSKTNDRSQSPNDTRHAVERHLHESTRWVQTTSCVEFSSWHRRNESSEISTIRTRCVSAKLEDPDDSVYNIRNHHHTNATHVYVHISKVNQ